MANALGNANYVLGWHGPTFASPLSRGDKVANSFDQFIGCVGSERGFAINGTYPGIDVSLAKHAAKSGFSSGIVFIVTSVLSTSAPMSMVIMASTILPFRRQTFIASFSRCS